MNSIAEGLASTDPSVNVLLPFLSLLFSTAIQMPVGSFPRLKLSILNLIGTALISYQMIHQIGSFDELFASNKESLPGIMNLLVHFLKEKPLESLSARTLKTICKACGANLTENIDALLSIWESMAPTFNSENKNKIVEAISLVMEYLPPGVFLEKQILLQSGIVKDMSGLMEWMQRVGFFSRGVKD